MPATLIFPLPSTPDPIYTNLWGELDDDTTQPSNTGAFETGINERDKQTCIVWGLPTLEPLTTATSYSLPNHTL